MDEFPMNESPRELRFVRVSQCRFQNHYFIWTAGSTIQKEPPWDARCDCGRWSWPGYNTPLAECEVKDGKVASGNGNQSWKANREES
jgi:hypothetical protein